MAQLQLLFLGDIVGRPGRELIRRGLPSLIERYNVDLVIANAENAAAGRGITREIGDALLARGVLVRNVSGYPRLHNCLRVTIGTAEQNDAFLAALKEVV